LILNNGTIGEIYNIGSEDEYSVLDVSKILIKKIKNSECIEDYISFVEDRPFNDTHTGLVIIKLKVLDGQ